MLKRALIPMMVLLCGVLILPPPAMAANERDIDFDWIGAMLDTLLSGFIPGLGVRLADADRDGDGINDDDALALLSAVLRGGYPRADLRHKCRRPGSNPVGLRQQPRSGAD